MYETYLLLNKLMAEQKTNFEKSLIGRLLRIRGKYILIRSSSYVGDINIDTALNTYTDFETGIYRKTKKIMEECNAWKYSHQWLDKYNALKKKTQKWWFYEGAFLDRKLVNFKKPMVLYMFFYSIQVLDATKLKIFYLRHFNEKGEKKRMIYKDMQQNQYTIESIQKDIKKVFNE